MKLCFSLAILCLALISVPAFADDDCDVPVRYWQSRDAALEHAVSLGWQVQRLKIDDGCYEIRGLDDRGRAFKAKLDPQTLRVVKMKLRKGADRHERERMPGRDDPASTTDDSVPAAGAASHGQIE